MFNEFLFLVLYLYFFFFIIFGIVVKKLIASLAPDFKIHEFQDFWMPNKLLEESKRNERIKKGQLLLGFMVCN
jgi:hypothetical protein